MGEGLVRESADPLDRQVRFVSVILAQLYQNQPVCAIETGAACLHEYFAHFGPDTRHSEV